MSLQGCTFGLMAAIAFGFGAGQTPKLTSTDLTAIEKELSTLCAQAAEADQVENNAVKNHSSKSLRVPLQSGPALWAFLTDPSTPYLDRMAAAHRGAHLIEREQLPKLWKAVAEFRHLPIGVDPSPCEFIANAWGARSPLIWANRAEKPVPGVVAIKTEHRSVLGRDIDLPVQAINYPLTLDARKHAPWLWQAQRALAVLSPGVQAYYRHRDHYPVLVEVAWAWQPLDWFEEQARVSALVQGPRNAEWLGVLVRLPAPGELQVLCGDSYHFEELVHATQIVILQKTKQARVAAEAAHQVAELAKKKDACTQVKPLRTATGILAIARWALDQNHLTQYARFSSAISEIVDAAPSRLDLRMPPKNPVGAISRQDLEQWFTTHRDQLEREALSERLHLRSLASELRLSID